MRAEGDGGGGWETHRCALYGRAGELQYDAAGVSVRAGRVGGGRAEVVHLQDGVREALRAAHLEPHPLRQSEAARVAAPPVGQHLAGGAAAVHGGEVAGGLPDQRLAGTQVQQHVVHHGHVRLRLEPHYVRRLAGQRHGDGHVHVVA